MRVSFPLYKNPYKKGFIKSRTVKHYPIGHLEIIKGKYKGEEFTLYKEFLKGILTLKVLLCRKGFILKHIEATGRVSYIFKS